MKSCCARGSRNAAQLAGSDPRSGGRSRPTQGLCRRQETRRATRNRQQMQLDASRGSVTETLTTGVNVISSGRYAPLAVEPGVVLEVQRGLGKQKRGEVGCAAIKSCGSSDSSCSMSKATR